MFSALRSSVDRLVHLGVQANKHRSGYCLWLKARYSWEEGGVCDVTLWFGIVFRHLFACVVDLFRPELRRISCLSWGLGNLVSRFALDVGPSDVVVLFSVVFGVTDGVLIFFLYF